EPERIGQKPAQRSEGAILGPLTSAEMHRAYPDRARSLDVAPEAVAHHKGLAGLNQETPAGLAVDRWVRLLQADIAGEERRPDPVIEAQRKEGPLIRRGQVGDKPEHQARLRERVKDAWHFLKERSRAKIAQKLLFERQTLARIKPEQRSMLP